MSTKNIPKVPNNIKYVREEKGMKRKDLAARLGIPYTTLANYENGTRLVPQGVYKRIADILNVSTEALEPDFIYLPIDILEYCSNYITKHSAYMMSEADFMKELDEKFPHITHFHREESRRYFRNYFEETTILVPSENIKKDNEKIIMKSFSKLNAKGQNNAIDYVEYLSTQEKYTKRETE